MGSLTARPRNPSARQQALIAAAAELFASRGYEAATTQAISAYAGCAEGLIHRYFGGKRGLLLSLIEHRASQELTALTDGLALAPTLADEYVQLVQWEIESMWQDQNFLRVILSRTLVEPQFGEALSRVGFSRHVPVFVERLSHFAGYRLLSEEVREAVAQSIKVLGLVFGFMRPVLLGQDRSTAREMALTIASTMVCGISAGCGSHANC